jgi:putative acetyltransferase
MADTTVYEAEGRVVGFLALIGNEVGAIFLDPDRPGPGIGRALMDNARDRRP